ncbi:MAG TPA: hypothetical protein VFT56_01010 [Sphingomonas sp.]|nr:hypothetical protein [Sphingomonas sp.]
MEETITIPTDPAQMTAEQAAAAQEVLDAYQAAQAAALAADRAAFLQPLTDLLAMPEYAAVKTAVLAIGSQFDNEAFAPHLNCLKTGFARLVVA